ALDQPQPRFGRRRRACPCRAGRRIPGAGPADRPPSRPAGRPPPRPPHRPARHRLRALLAADPRPLRPAGAGARARLRPGAACPRHLCRAGPVAGARHRPRRRATRRVGCGRGHGPHPPPAPVPRGAAAGDAGAAGRVARRLRHPRLGGNRRRLYQRRRPRHADPHRPRPGPYREDPGRRRPRHSHGPADRCGPRRRAAPPAGEPL
ncbi:MAG: hypothetical protein AVDCRST_MAG27-1371, partial [uncultured Craurococcus sp.]